MSRGQANLNSREMKENMRVWLAVVSVFFSGVSPALACKTLDNPSVRLARSSKINSHCVDIFLSFPEFIEKYEAVVPRLTIQSANGFGVSAELHTKPSRSQKGDLVAYFCLSEKVMQETKIVIEYWDLNASEDVWFCEYKIELDQLDRLLAASDAEKK